MADKNIAKTTVSDMTHTVDNFQIPAMQTDGISENKETEYSWANWTKWYGYYRKVPVLKKSIDAYATWAVGKGYEADNFTTAQLSNITGWGEDTFQSILWNMVVIKKINGDSFAEIIRNEKTGTLVNLKTLDPGSMKVIVNDKGIIKRYEQTTKTGDKTAQVKYRPDQILHLVNERVADEIHGISVVESVEETILARAEAVDDWKTVLHRNVVPLTVVEVDVDNQAKIDGLKKKYEAMINNKEVLFVPKGAVEIKRDALPSNATMNPIPTIQYYDEFFYQAVGIPRIILGGSSEFTEATAKIAYLTFAQTYTREQREIEADLWNQLAIKIKIVQPVSIQNELMTDESKDKGTEQAAPPDEMGVRMGQE